MLLVLARIVLMIDTLIQVLELVFNVLILALLAILLRIVCLVKLLTFMMEVVDVRNAALSVYPAIPLLFVCHALLDIIWKYQTIHVSSVSQQ